MGNRGGAGKRNGDISGLKQFHVKTQGEDDHIQAKEEGLEQN